MPPTDYHYDDLVVIQQIIGGAADEILGAYFSRSTADYKADGSIVTEADLALQQTLARLLQQRYPDVLMLGEEHEQQAQTDIIDGDNDYWCVDPLDGTTNFHATLPLFSVSLGLVSGGQPVLGIVYDPNRREFFGAIRGQGFWIDGECVERPRQPTRLEDCIAFIDFKRLPDTISTSLVQQTPYKSQRNIGTCALEWAWLAAGRVNLVLHGRERLWDYAAGVLLVDESGGLARTFEGESIFQPSLSPRSVMAASTPELFDLWSARIGSIE